MLCSWSVFQQHAHFSAGAPLLACGEAAFAHDPPGAVLLETGFFQPSWSLSEPESELSLSQPSFVICRDASD